MRKNLFIIIIIIIIIPSTYGQTTVTIGSGTSTWRNLPIELASSRSRGATIYLSSEIEASGTITVTEIAWYVGSTSWSTCPGKIYLKETTQSTFSSQGWSTVTTGATEVFVTSGTPFNTTGWITFTLTTPFTYDASNNLMVLFEQNRGSTGSNASFRYNFISSRSQYWLNPAYDWSSGTVSSDVPHIRITYTTGGGGGNVLYEEDFFTTSLALATSSGWSRNSGTTNACIGGDYAYYSSITTNYFATNAFRVPRGKGVNINFDMKRSSGSSILEIYARVGGYGTWNTLNRERSGWMRLSTSHLTYSTSCSNFTVSLPAEICGGQDLSILFRATGTNITIDNIVITDNSAKSSVPDISVTPLTYNLDASGNFWGPVNFSNFNTSATENIFSYRTYYGCNNSSGAYAYITSIGGNGGQVNIASVPSNRHLAFINTSNGDCTGAPGGSASIITREFNTSACSGSTATLRFAFKANYPGYTSDETYTLYTPRVFYAVTNDGPATGLTWIEANVNYYFPNGLWWYATTSLPKEQNLVVAFAPRSGRVDDFRIDDIKILCSDCSINPESGGAISCTSHPGLSEYQPSMEYTFTIGATPFATNYKWIVRDLTSSDIYYGTTAGINPAIVAGQGTQTATINFGSTGGTSFRVMCIPYDGDFGTDISPTDACYAKISIYQTLTENEIETPVELISFYAECSDRKHLLRWSTASETNNDYFILQKSHNGLDFTDIILVPGAGNSSILNEYNYLTKTQSNQTYYRLKQVDYDGTENFSKIIHATNCYENFDDNLFQIFPNPIISNQFSIYSQNEYPEITIKIIDNTGKVLYQKVFRNFLDYIHIKMDSHPAKGQYKIFFIVDESIIFSNSLIFN